MHETNRPIEGENSGFPSKLFSANDFLLRVVERPSDLEIDENQHLDPIVESDMIVAEARTLRRMAEVPVHPVHHVLVLLGRSSTEFADSPPVPRWRLSYY